MKINEKGDVEAIIYEKSKEFGLRNIKIKFKFDNDLLNFLIKINKDEWIYIYNDKKEFRENILKIGIIVNYFLKNNIKPNFIYSNKETRENFLKIFEKAKIIYYKDSPTISESFELSKYDKESFLNQTSNILITDWKEEFMESDYYIYIKNNNYQSDKKSIVSKFDYEDNFMKEEKIKNKPILIFVNNFESLPHPEKILKNRINIIPLINELNIEEPKIINEDQLRINHIKINDEVLEFFDSLKFNEKNKFISLFLNNIWDKLNNIGEIKKPDEYDKEYFSEILYKQEQLSNIFEELIENIKIYILSNEIKIPKELLTLKYEKNEIFVPKDKFFEKIYVFLNAKRIFYSKLPKRSYEEQKNKIKNDAKEFCSTYYKKYIKEEIDVDIEDEEEKEIEINKIYMIEQYGKEKTKEIECKKIIVSSDNKYYQIFIPLKSNSKIDKITRNDNEISNIKYNELKEGDKFEKSYWTFEKLIEEIRVKNIDENEKINKAIFFSIEFRNKLEDFVDKHTRQEVIKIVQEKLDEKGYKKEVNYQTIILWISSVMVPNKQSIPLIEALGDIIYERSNINIAEKFIMSNKIIKNQRRKLRIDDDSIESGYTVNSIEEKIYMVRGENVGKMYRIT